jgi:hypothetical protein
MELQPLNTFRQGSNEVCLLRHDGRELLAKRYRGDHAATRCDYERSALQLWASCQFPVPQVWPIEVPQWAGSPHLVTDYLGRLTLQEWLQDQTVAPAERYEFLARIFRENHRRHRLALERREPRLIHADPNSSNVLRTAGGFCFIDLERPTEIADLAEAAAVEIGKFCRWTVRDMGRVHLKPILQSVIEAYAEERPLLQRFVDRTCARGFQWLHRWRDRKRRARQPGEITKYDLADTLVELLGSSRLG